MLNGKVALVTGSTSGIGLGIARTLAAEGTDVVLNGLSDAAAVDTLQSEMQAEFGVRVDYRPADMSRPEQIVEMIEQATARLGQIDILINNAGIQHTAPVQEFPVEKWVGWPCGFPVLTGGGPAAWPGARNGRRLDGPVTVAPGCGTFGWPNAVRGDHNGIDTTDGRGS